MRKSLLLILLCLFLAVGSADARWLICPAATPPTTFCASCSSSVPCEDFEGGYTCSGTADITNAYINPSTCTPIVCGNDGGAADLEAVAHTNSWSSMCDDIGSYAMRSTVDDADEDAWFRIAHVDMNNPRVQFYFDPVQISTLESGDYVGLITATSTDDQYYLWRVQVYNQSGTMKLWARVLLTGHPSSGTDCYSSVTVTQGVPMGIRVAWNRNSNDLPLTLYVDNDGDGVFDDGTCSPDEEDYYSLNYAQAYIYMGPEDWATSLGTGDQAIIEIDNVTVKQAAFTSPCTNN